MAPQFIQASPPKGVRISFMSGEHQVRVPQAPEVT